MVGRFAEFAADQHGARHIQAILQDASGQGGDSFGAGSSSGSSTDSPPASSTDEPTEGAPIIATIFAEIIPAARELVKDPFGNYVLQKLLECGSDEQREAIVRSLVEDLVGVCRHPYGCRVVQTALETVAGPQLELLVGRLANEQVVMACVVDSNANHVLQKCIQVVPLEHAGAVVRVFYGKAGNLSMHAYGCRVMQRVMEHVPLQLKGPLLDEVIDISDDLAQDQYANYVLQHVLSHRHTTAGQRDRVVQKLIPLLSTLCCHRYASNVVEKCLEHGTAKQASAKRNSDCRKTQRFQIPLTCACCCAEASDYPRGAGRPGARRQGLGQPQRSGEEGGASGVPACARLVRQLRRAKADCLRGAGRAAVDLRRHPPVRTNRHAAAAWLPTGFRRSPDSPDSF